MYESATSNDFDEDRVARGATQFHPSRFDGYRLVYPVVSRRANGVSIGVNLSPTKLCNFRCVYCQVARGERAEEIERALDDGASVDATPLRTCETFDAAALKREALQLGRAAIDGSLFANARFADVPDARRVLRDFAFSGDGEPTLSPFFPQGVEALAQARDELGCEAVKLVLITNATRLTAPTIVDALDRIGELVQPTEDWIQANCPEAEVRVQRFAMGPTTKSEVEARISGPDKKILRELANQAKALFADEPTAKFVRDDWRQDVPTWTPLYSQTKGRQAMISRSEALFALRWASKGIACSYFPDGEELLPIILRAAPEDRNNSEFLRDVPVWGKNLQSVPLSLISESVGVRWEPGVIARRNQTPTITVGADPRVGSWSDLYKKLKPKLDELELPPGYAIEWGGQYERSQNATAALVGETPIAFILMAIIVVALFNGLRQPLIIVMTFPLAMIGVTVGMLVMNKPFGFMALIGAMSLLGMMVRNGVVLMDQIDEELAKGESKYDAIVDASVERMRPVTVAALTVIVGMTPLLRDPLFDSMATVIMFGLIFSTALTLYVAPILYSILFRVPTSRRARRRGR